LYSKLSYAIPFLCSGLQDADEKTRANAAGALGNFARNGGELCDFLCAEKCPQRLLGMTVYDPAVFTKVGALFTLSPVTYIYGGLVLIRVLQLFQRIALFSVGTLVGYASCR
jgi:hypothetical protein